VALVYGVVAEAAGIAITLLLPGLSSMLCCRTVESSFVGFTTRPTFWNTASKQASNEGRGVVSHLTERVYMNTI
jgi:hypothetical protein